MKRILHVGLFVILVLSTISTGCGSKNTGSSSGVGELNGTITISGAFALYPLMVRWGEEFQKLHPDVKFDISAGGAGKGMTDALSGAVDIGMVSRAIAPEEEQKGAFWVSVTKDAVFVVVNEKNPVLADIKTKGFTKEVLSKIYITGEITTWGQVIGKPEITDPIHVFTRSDSAGAPDAFAKYLDKKQEDLLGIGVSGDPGLLDAVIKDPLGIGFNNLNYAFDANSGVPASGAYVASLDANTNGKVDPEEVYNTKQQAIAAIKTGKYPSPPARDLNLVTKGKPTGLFLTFIKWILSDGQKFIDEVGYIQLPNEQLSGEINKLK